jgi:hypothetical protein
MQYLGKKKLLGHHGSEPPWKSIHKVMLSLQREQEQDCTQQLANVRLKDLNSNGYEPSKIDELEYNRRQFLWLAIHYLSGVSHVRWK